MNVNLPVWGYAVGLTPNRLPAEWFGQLGIKKNPASNVHTRIKQEFETPREGFRTNKPGAARRPASREKTESVTRQLPWGARRGALPKAAACSKRVPAGVLEALGCNEDTHGHTEKTCRQTV